MMFVFMKFKVRKFNSIVDAFRAKTSVLPKIDILQLLYLKQLGFFSHVDLTQGAHIVDYPTPLICIHGPCHQCRKLSQVR